jgi:hypothetical protein
VVTSGRDTLDLSDGARLLIDGQEWTVVAYYPQVGQVQLRSGSGQSVDTTVAALVNNPDCQQSESPAARPAARRGRQPSGLDDLADRHRQMFAARYSHLMETETGYRSGTALRALASEPRPQYDPDKTTVTQRRAAKVAELRAMPPDEAQALGLAHVSVRTLRRWATSVGNFDVEGLIDGHWVRRAVSRPSVTEDLRTAIITVRQENAAPRPHQPAVEVRAHMPGDAEDSSARYGRTVRGNGPADLAGVVRAWRRAPEVRPQRQPHARAHRRVRAGHPAWPSHRLGHNANARDAA